jgi:hypothetical protein
MPRPNAIEASERFRQQLLNEVAAATERMAIIYNRIFTGLQDEVSQLAEQIAEMEPPDKEDIMRLARMQRVLRQVADQAERFGGVVQNEIAVIQTQSIEKGIDDTLKLMELSLPELPPELQREIVGSFTRLPADAVEAAAGLFGDDSPLVERLQSAYGEYVASQVEKHIVDGIAVGQNPRRIARLLERNLQSSLGSGLSSALTTVRTAQIKSYQIANHATYRANPNLVPGWIWHAELDDRVCLSCVAQHGTEHPVDERLNDHHNGRCAPLPKTITYRQLGIDLPETVPPTQRGTDWFRQQSASRQRAMMGGAMYDAWRADKFRLEELSRPYDDVVYGELLREASLKDLLGEQAREFYK